MKCEKCRKEAEFHFARLNNKIILILPKNIYESTCTFEYTKHLCEECAKKEVMIHILKENKFWGYHTLECLIRLRSNKHKGRSKEKYEKDRD